ncbi:hypothetical protein A2165_03590 [Candidatus Curtissbacteria bacterium RBG_13_40_7]|uniref:Uncharacterized protein n=1 Tax=Candidatus Curtissbacteria bacterium RBG_13_40_7 TaxID=1797706 RepID=A0A1F5FX59_9BACT|nr:MAG: hypothetical protein A2165_03590 [Candidatus Curtissbacteria bacterium RBG_13_40_7]
MSRNIVIISIIVLVFLLIGASYLIYKKPSATSMPSDQSPSASPISIVQSPLATSSQAPILTLALTQNAIKNNINAKNYQGLIPYMTNKVNVSLQATECCGEKTPDEAVSQMSYIDEGIPLDFDQSSELIRNLKSKNPLLSDKFIGVSTTNIGASTTKEYLIAFTINNQDKISEVLMAVSWKLFSY